MKILALTSEFVPFAGGIGTYAAELARAAAQLGHEVSVAAPDYGLDLAQSDRRDFPFEIVRYPGGPHRAVQMPVKLALTKRLVARGGFDLVHAMDWPFFLPAALAARHLPRLHTVHGSEIADMARAHKRMAVAAAGVFWGEARVLGVSAYTLARFRAQFPRVPAARTGFVHLGVGEDWLGASGLSERRALGLPEDRLVVLTLARVTRRKGHLGALRALALLPEALRSRVYYAIAGPDGEADFGAELAVAIAASPVQVGRFKGLDRQEVMGLCAASDIFCLPGAPVDGQVEGFGLVLLEAGSQGLPLVAGHVGGVGEVVEDGVSGLLVPVGDDAALAGALGRLIVDAALRRQLGQGARARAEALSWRRCAAASYGGGKSATG